MTTTFEAKKVTIEPNGDTVLVHLDPVETENVADLEGKALTNYLAHQIEIDDRHYVLGQDRSGVELIYTGDDVADWALPELNNGYHHVIHNTSKNEIVFKARRGMKLKGKNCLPSGCSCSVTWLPDKKVKLLGELVDAE